MFRYGMLITIEDKAKTGQHQSGAHPIHLGLKPYINVMFQALINEEISLFDKSLQWRILRLDWWDLGRPLIPRGCCTPYQPSQ